MEEFEAMREAGDEFGILLDCAARQILREENPARFIVWFNQYAPSLAPGFLGQLPDDADFRRAFLTQFSRLIWNRTPLPGNHYRPRPMPKPERNQPCLCGSGKKYKHCCYAAEGLEREMPEFSMLLHVLGTLPVRQFSILPFAHMNLEELDFVAREWLMSGHAREAMKLLEGLFNSGVALDERTEPAFHCLVDCYDRLDNPLKKKRLLERGMAAKDSYFRASSMQRMCSILADRGEYAEAWRLFGEAQRLQPDDPSLAHLEIAMLKSQGEDARAKSRAEFWIARLSRDKSGEYDNLIEFLRGAADDLDGSMLDMMREDLPALDAFARLAGNIPQPACHYHLQDMDGSAGPLEPDVRLKKLHQSWRRASTGLQEENGILWHLPQPWLDWLRKEPLAWQSFDVLFDLMEGLEYSSPSLAGMEGETVLPILRHAEALLRKVIETNRVDGLKLEWGWRENRPALSLIERLAMILAVNDRRAEAIELMAWMVNTLNPNDNQGLRDKLLHLYLRERRIEDALKLAARYPDDFSATCYGHVLALFMSGDAPAARALLEATFRRYPEPAKMLASANPRKPKLQYGLMTLGGKDEAWYYREEHLDIWRESGGLEWLRKTLPGLKGK